MKLYKGMNRRQYKKKIGAARFRKVMKAWELSKSPEGDKHIFVEWGRRTKNGYYIIDLEPKEK